MTLLRLGLLLPTALAFCACYSVATPPPTRSNAGHTTLAQHKAVPPHKMMSSGRSQMSSPEASPTVHVATRKRQRYILVDGVAMEAAISVARQINPAHRSLYSGLPEDSFGVLAPHLFRYELGSQSEKLWMGIGRGRAWGLQIIAAASIDQVVSHLQRFLLTDLQGGGGHNSTQIYLRFYDPRVMHTLLQALDPGQRRAFFGPIERFILQHDELKDVDTHYTLRSDGQLIKMHRRVPSMEAPPLEKLAGTVKMAREEAFLRSQIKHYGQLTALRNASSSATPFCSICPCNEFEVKRPGGLTLTSAQQSKFSEHALRWYKHGVFESLKAKNSRLSAIELKGLIDHGLKRGKQYEIDSQKQVYNFIELLLHNGSNFDRRYPWARRILTDKNLDQDEKMERLQQERNKRLGKPD